MGKIKVKFLPLILIFQTLCFVGVSQTNSGLEVFVTVDRQFLFGDTSMLVKIKMITNRKTLKTFDLETGTLDMELIQTFPDGNKKKYLGSTGGPFRYYTTPGVEVIEFNAERVEQKQIELKRGDTLVKELDLYKTFGKSLAVASYLINVDFETKAHGSEHFSILANYEVIMPRILSYLERQKTIQGISPLFHFSYLTGEPEWFNEFRFVPTIPGEKVNELMGWWQENKAVILTMETYYNKSGFAPLALDKTVPELLNQLEYGDYLQRKDARDILHEILGIPGWLPDPAGVDDLQMRDLRNLWNQKKDLILYVGSILEENAKLVK